MPSAGRTLRADAARNYERIVDAALTVFEEVGAEATLEEIAERAAVSVATLYRRFRTREQVVRAVFDHVLSTEIEPLAAAHTDDPWQDLAGWLEATIEVLADRRVLLALAKESRVSEVESVQRCAASMQRLLQRAIDAEVVRPELQVRDLAAVIVMVLATAHSEDPHGADRRRYLALLLDGLRARFQPLPS